MYLWQIFWDISSGRGSNGWGPNPLSFSEIKAWSELQDIPLVPWEVTAIKAMDGAYLRKMNQAKPKPSENKNVPAGRRARTGM